MQANRVKTLSEHREHFARFVALLTGELGVEAVFGDEPGSSGHAKIVLPKIEDLDSKRLDFLYALCLREAGLLSMSKRSVASIASHATQGELATSFAIESGRVERALMRKFAGASEILDQHWKAEAADVNLGPMAFGIDPRKASVDQAFPFVAKWALVGKPAYGWDKLFPKAAWSECVAAIESEPLRSLVADSRLRRWDDARGLAGALWKGWIALRGADGTKALTPSPKARALAEAEKALRETIPAAIDHLIKERDEHEAKAKAAAERARKILSDNEAKLAELERSIAALEKQKAPFSAVAERLTEARQHSSAAEAARQAQQSSQSLLDSLRQEALGRQSDASKTAEERAQKDAEKAADLEKRLDEAREAMEQARREADQGPAQAEQRRAELDEKRAQSRQETAAKAAEAQGKIDAERAKAESAEGSKREKIERRVEELQARLAEQQAKAANQDAKARARAEQASEAASRKADEAVERAAAQIQDLERRVQAAHEAAQARQERAAQKGAPTASLQKRTERASEQLAQAKASEAASEDGASQARASARALAAKLGAIAAMSEEDLLAKVAELEAALAQAEKETSDIVDPARSSQAEAREERKAMREANKMAMGQAQKEMQKLQDKLDDQGVPCDLVDRMEEIDGWDGANQAQSEFDKRASEELGESVVNGSGGGAGNRDALEEIALRAQGIEEINPNEIFSGVEKLSPLSGFSQGGADGSGGQVDASESSGQGFASIKAHLVWRKDRDKIIPAPRKDQAAVRALQTRYAADIAQVKKVFLSKMKPSFKTRFRGGREEGQLDGRAIWKLAAGQGDDYFEIDSKKPDNKASASILVDVSGSLASLGPDAAEMIQACALLLSEGLSACSIDHEILGHCAPYEPEFGDQKIPATFNRRACRLETVVAKNFGEKSLAGMASLELRQADNSDGEAARIALGRLKKRPGKKKMLFMISDGKPFMQDADIEILDEDLRRAMLEAAAQKVMVVSVGFGPNGHPVFGARHMGLETVAELAKVLAARLDA